MSVMGMLKAYRHSGTAKLEGLVNGKTVALVGNATSLFGKNLGAEIDRHDTIIRLNRGAIKDPGQQGSRTTVLGTSRGLAEDMIQQQFDPQLVMWLTSKRWNIPHWSAAVWAKTDVMPLNLWRELFVRLGHRPTSGLMMLSMIDKLMQPEQLNIFGFDFYESPNFYRGPPPANSPHSPAAEKQLALEIIAGKKNFSLR